MNSSKNKNNTRRTNAGKAFSLVEMLMALLVASLLLAALAPVMTRRFDENIGVYDISPKGQEETAIYHNNSSFTVPNNVSRLEVTSIGGGGAGGGSTYGSKEITSTETNWEVPEGVTKIRVFMVGAGGGGASGVKSTASYSKAYSAGTISETYKDFTSAGSYTLSDYITIPAATVPSLPTECTTYGATTWNNGYKPGDTISASNSNITLTKVTACGGGGGGGGGRVTPGGGGGGSGGYRTDIVLNKTATPSSVVIRIGAGGGGGGGANQTHTKADKVIGLSGGSYAGGGGGGCSSGDYIGSGGSGASSGGGAKNGSAGEIRRASCRERV